MVSQGTCNQTSNVISNHWLPTQVNENLQVEEFLISGIGAVFLVNDGLIDSDCSRSKCTKSVHCFQLSYLTVSSCGENAVKSVSRPLASNGQISISITFTHDWNNDMKSQNSSLMLRLCWSPKSCRCSTRSCPSIRKESKLLLVVVRLRASSLLWKLTMATYPLALLC